MIGKIEKYRVNFTIVAIIIFLLTFSFGYAQEIDTTPAVILELNGLIGEKII